MSNPSGRILIIEDDPSIVLGLRMNLSSEGYEVGVATNGEEGIAKARDQRWDLIILDLMLPKINGYELVCTVRAEQVKTPILIVSARTAEVDKIMGLDLGADDYMTKPFAVGELLARVRVLLRRSKQTTESVWSFGQVEVNAETREVRREGEKVDLTATEFDILVALIRAQGRVLSRDQIMDVVWGPNHHGTPRTVDNFIAQLRAKLERDPSEPEHLLTSRGVGYRLSSSSAVVF